MRLLILATALALAACRQAPAPRPAPATALEALLRDVAIGFQAYDADGDRRLSFVEWFRTPPSRLQDGHAIFGQADVDGDGFLTRREIMAWADAQATAAEQ